jgi:hypothetical protein
MYLPTISVEVILVILFVGVFFRVIVIIRIVVLTDAHTVFLILDAFFASLLGALAVSRMEVATLASRLTGAVGARVTTVLT